MSWNNCKKCVIVPRSSYTSALFKVLLTLKLLHGGRTGAKGSTLEDIAMHMIKHFCLDGDIKSQVLASLKYGVKMHFIQKRKEKFSLILPSSSIHLAPCKFKNEETERIHCIFPPTWYSNACNDDMRSGDSTNQSCCGKRIKRPSICCHADDEPDVCSRHSQDTLYTQSSGGSSRSKVCSECSKSKIKKPRICPKPLPPICARKGQGKCNELCQFCDARETEEHNCSSYPYDAYVNCRCIHKK